MRSFLLNNKTKDDRINAILFNEQSFYDGFLSDLQKAKSEVIIESPFVTTRRMNDLLPVLRKLRQRGVAVYVNTRDPMEHNALYDFQATAAVQTLQELGIEVLYTAKHHRKLAIIDRKIVWNGSLNILSYSDSSEIMWRMISEATARELIGFVKLTPYTKGTL